MSQSFLTETTVQAKESFVARLVKIGVSASQAAHLCSMAGTAMRYYQGDKTARKFMRQSQEIEQRWYESLKSDSPDYSVYSDDIMLSEVFACWRIYSRKYLNSLRSKSQLILDLGEIKTIADLGCGLGYTTASLGQIFPDADVNGTNIPGTQTKFAEDVTGIKIKSNLKEIVCGADLVFASEYFEHFESPVEHLREVIQELQPKVLIIANAFGAKSVGHFDFYKIEGVATEPRKTSKAFNSELRAKGYKPMQTKLWNNRPMFWKKCD